MQDQPMFYEKQRLLFANSCVQKVTAENSKARSSQTIILLAGNTTDASNSDRHIDHKK